MIQQGQFSLVVNSNDGDFDYILYFDFFMTTMIKGTENDTVGFHLLVKVPGPKGKFGKNRNKLLTAPPYNFMRTLFISCSWQPHVHVRVGLSHARILYTNPQPRPRTGTGLRV